MPRRLVFILLVGLVFAAPPSFSQSLNRPVDEVVVKGSQLGDFLTSPAIPLDQLHLYRWTGSSFEPIPFQIDEVKFWMLTDNIAGCSASGIPPGKEVCETNYAFDFATGDVGTDATPGLDGDDELLFLARDAGSAAPSTAWLPGAVSNQRYDIRIVDQRLDASNQMETLGEGYVYLFRWNQSHAPEYTRHYVEWEAMGASPDPLRAESCQTLDPVPARGLKACGWARGNANATTGQNQEPTLDIRYIGNWIINRVRVRTTGNSLYPDLIDRFKKRIGVCFGGPCQSEYTWSVGGCPRFKGLKAWEPVSKAWPVAVERLIQSSMSGVTTTRTDRILGTHARITVRLRVHAGVGPLREHVDFLSTATPLNLYNSTYPPDAVPKVAADVIDGGGVDHDPTGSYVQPPGPTNFNWNQIDTTDRGRIAIFIRENRPLWFTGSSEYYYDDAGNPAGGAQDVPESDPGRYGNPGAKWNGVTLNMQDTTCDPNDPNDPKGTWREIETVIFALADGRESATYLDWLQRPVRSYTRSVIRDSTPPVLPTPCKPTLNAVNPDTGFSLTLNVSDNCPAATAGYEVFRATGPGSFQYMTTVPRSSSYVDASVLNGVTYRYQVFGFNEEGGFGSASDEAQVAAVDLQAPLSPTDVTAVPLSQGARIDWTGSASFDTVGHDVYLATTSGGPYQKINSQPVAIPKSTLTLSALDPSATYFIVVKAADLAGNESVASAEVSVTPLP